MRGFSDRVIAFVLACGLLAAGMTPARPGPYEDALAHFTEDSFDQTIEGVSGIVASGNALAVTVIGALQEGGCYSIRRASAFSSARSPTACWTPRPGNISPAMRLRTFRQCGSTTACAASSRRRSGA